MLKTADMRPQLYRHYLLRNLSAGKELVTPQTEWAAAIQEAAVERAKSDFYSAFNDNDGRVQEIGGSRIEPTSTTGSQPKFRLSCNATGHWIRNPTRRAQSRSGARFPSASRDVTPSSREERLLPGFVVSSNMADYIVDTGAGEHVKSMADLTPEQRKHLKPLQEPVVMNTANGPVVVDKCIELQLLDLGGARTLTFQVMDNSPSLLSVSKLVLEENFKFYWEHERAHLVTPEGKHFWLITSGGDS